MTIRDLWDDLDGKVMELRNRVMFCMPGESLDCQGLINDMVDAKEGFVKAVLPFLETTVQSGIVAALGKQVRCVGGK